MSEQIRRPTANKTVQLTPIPSPPNYGNVDEEVADDNDYNYSATNENILDYFTHSVFSIEEGATEILVKQKIRAKRTDTDIDLRIWGVLGLLVGATTYVYNSYVLEGGYQYLTTGWIDYEFVWPLNPGTGLAWTRDQINGIGNYHISSEGYGVGADF